MLPFVTIKNEKLDIYSIDKFTHFYPKIKIKNQVWSEQKF